MGAAGSAARSASARRKAPPLSSRVVLPAVRWKRTEQGRARRELTKTRRPRRIRGPRLGCRMRGARERRLRWQLLPSCCCLTLCDPSRSSAASSGGPWGRRGREGGRRSDSSVSLWRRLEGALHGTRLRPPIAAAGSRRCCPCCTRLCGGDGGQLCCVRKWRRAAEDEVGCASDGD